MLRAMGWHRLVVGVAITAAASGCATLPQPAPQRALYSDLRQIVQTRERVGWVIDRSEIEEAAPDALHSVCQVEVEQRFALLDWFEARIEAEGGPSRDSFERSGELSGLGEVMTLERMRALLEYADERAEKDCPYWMKPDAEFSGVQTDTDKFVIIAESMGRLSLLFGPDNDVNVGAGGAFRIIPSYGVSDRVTLGAGIELGGLGTLSQAGDDQKLSARPIGAIPLLVRLHDDTWLYDFEVTPMVQYHDSTISWPPGIRGAFALGIGAVRIGSIMPVGMAYIGYEYQPTFRDLPRTHALSIGTRVDVNFDP